MIKTSLSRKEIIVAAIGICSLIYVFYAGFFAIPPHLNKILIFLSIFVGLSVVLYPTNGLSRIIALFIFVGLCFLPLTWLWRGAEFDNFMFMGLFPFNDGQQYLTDAYRLLMGLDFTHISTRRPIFTGLLTFIMWVFNENLQVSLGVLCAGTAISLYFLAAEVRKIFGFAAAGLISTVLFYCYLPYVGRVYTENIGLSLGALGLAILLKGARLKNLAVLFIGSFSLSLALNARVGALFVFPALVIWGWAKRKDFGRQTPYIILGAISLGFVINYLLSKTIGNPNGFLFSNFSYTLFGLASGYKGWAYIYRVYPNILDYNAYPYTFELIRNNPLMLVLGILRSYADFLRPERMFQFMYFGNQQVIISYILYGLTLLGLFRLLSFAKDHLSSLIIALGIGSFLSVSFIPPIDDGIRAMTATIPISILFAALSLRLPGNRQDTVPENVKYPISYFIFLVAFIVFGPLLVKVVSTSTKDIPKISCPDGYDLISVKVMKGNYINIIEDGGEYAFLPDIRRKDILLRLRSYTREEFPPMLEDFQALYALVKKLKPGETILMGLNIQELNNPNGPEKLIYMVTLTSKIQNNGSVNNFCASLALEERLRSNRFYFDLSVEPKE